MNRIVTPAPAPSPGTAAPGTSASTPVSLGAGTTGWKDVGLRSWGRGQVAHALVARPERMRELRAALDDSDPQRTLLARGAGRSYGDVCLNADGSVILAERLNRILSFDSATGLVVVEPGVTFADLLAVFLPQGFRAPVSPGTSFVTIGGAVANDVHGKNQHIAGSFGDCIEWLDLLCADGELRRISPTQNTALFDATVGGIGLTGIVTAACVRMVPVASPALLVRRRRVSGLEDFLARFEEASSVTYSVGWIDVLASGSAVGRGILETAEPAPRGAEPPPPPRARRMPIDLPGWALNGTSVRAFNALYWRRAQPDAREVVSNYAQFLYPLDAITDWNRLYGTRGFHQFQCVVPRDEGVATLMRLLRTAAAGGGASFLAVLKVMGRSGRGLLSFAQPGYSLALDFASGAHTTELFRALEHITRDAGGRIYMAKDSMMSPESFSAMYPDSEAFQQMRATIDPGRRFSSSLSRRIGLG